MEPYPQHCLICGREITSGIDAHMRYTHEMSYETYCKHFYECEGSYSVYQKKGKTILTITRELGPE